MSSFNRTSLSYQYFMSCQQYPCIFRLSSKRYLTSPYCMKPIDDSTSSCSACLHAVFEMEIFAEMFDHQYLKLG